MTVAGNLAFQSGALYLVQLNSTTSTFANVTGTATLGGTVGAVVRARQHRDEAIHDPDRRTAASAAPSTASHGRPAGGLVGTLSYDPTHAYLNFALDFGARRISTSTSRTSPPR